MEPSGETHSIVWLPRHRVLLLPHRLLCRLLPCQRAEETKVKHLSLFSGIGGIDLAAEWAGFESAIMVERDQYCQQVLRKNFPTTQIFDDVTTFNGLELKGEIDLISAGFPCQPHSLAGKRKASADERDLWGEVVRIVGEVQPRWFLGENVPGLLSSESGRFFGRVVNDLVQMGYRVGWACYGAKDIGAVHRRNRVFITAYSKHVRCEDIQEEGLERQDHQEREEGRSEQSSRGGLREYACHSEGEPRLQADSTTCSIGSQRDAREDFGGRHWQPISGGNWREWDTCPIVYETRSESRVRRKDDGIPHRVDRLKCLGNAVVPQQIYPILEEMQRLSIERP